MELLLFKFDDIRDALSAHRTRDAHSRLRATRALAVVANRSCACEHGGCRHRFM
jgi:hypothetical protein